MTDTTTPVTPEERKMFAEDATSVLSHEKKNLERWAAARAILRLLTALEAAEARKEEAESSLALEAAEARKEEAESSLARAFTGIGEMSAGIEKIAAANHALAEKAQQAEAENAKLRSERDWLAKELAHTALDLQEDGARTKNESQYVIEPRLTTPEYWTEAARRAVAESEEKI